LRIKLLPSAAIPAKARIHVNPGIRRDDEARASTLGLRIEIRTAKGAVYC
jgi:hypothetical protein